MKQGIMFECKNKRIKENSNYKQWNLIKLFWYAYFAIIRYEEKKQGRYKTAAGKHNFYANNRDTKIPAGHFYQVAKYKNKHCDAAINKTIALFAAAAFNSNGYHVKRKTQRGNKQNLDNLK